MAYICMNHSLSVYHHHDRYQAASSRKFSLKTIIPIRSFRKRLIVQVELMEVTALILANITFLSLAHARHQSLVCTGLVFGVQYLYLVTIAWSFVAALVFYRQVRTVC